MKTNGLDITAVNGKVRIASSEGGPHLDITPEDAMALADVLVGAVAKARDPRVYRDCVKPGEFYTYTLLEGRGKKVYMAVSDKSTLWNKDVILSNVQVDSSGHPSHESPTVLVYRCKDFGGEIL